MAKNPNYDKWVEMATKQSKGKSPDSLNWQSPEGITIKPLYTSGVLASLTAFQV